MKFVDELDSLEPTQQNASAAEKKLVRYQRSGRQAVKQACLEKRTRKSASGYLLVSYDNSQVPGLGYFEKLYCHEYPYRIDLGRPLWFRNSVRRIAQIGTEKKRVCNEFRDVVSRDRAFCDALIERLRAALVPDGFRDIVLEAVPVYCAEVRRFRESTPGGSRQYEEGRLTDEAVGFAIYFEVCW